jgi:capsid protein
LRFESGDAAYDSAAEDFLTDWFKTADVRGMNSFQDLAWLAVRQVNVDGDGGFLLLKDGRIQPIESELIQTPPDASEQTIQGVERDAYGRPLRFWVCPRHLGSGLPDKEKAVPISARDFVFYRQFFRFDSGRGIPTAAAILPDLIDQRELHRAYVRKTKSDATRAFAVHTEDGMMPDNLRGRTAPGVPSFQDNRPPTWEDSGLKAFFLKDTERVENLTPATPSGTIVNYEEWLIRSMSSALGIPAEFWTLDLRSLSWSTANATVKLAGDAFRSIHSWACEQFIEPILNWRLLMAIRDGDIPPGPTAKRPNGLRVSFYNRYRVAIPEYLWADEEQHYKAAKLGWQLGAKSLDDIAGERGESAKEMLARKKGDILTAIEIAADLTKATGVTVSWDQIINAGTPGVVSMAEIDKRESAKQEAQQ